MLQLETLKMPPQLHLRFHVYKTELRQDGVTRLLARLACTSQCVLAHSLL